MAQASRYDENEEFQPRREMVRELESLKSENKCLEEELEETHDIIRRLTDGNPVEWVV